MKFSNTTRLVKIPMRKLIRLNSKINIKLCIHYLEYTNDQTECVILIKNRSQICFQ
jgi:hypothetical protein